MDRAEQKKEAIYRMRFLDMHPNAVREFEREDKVNVSEYGLGILYWADEEQSKLIKAFEEEYNAVVYHVIHSFTTFGELFSMLYVSSEDEEWELDRADLKEGYAVAYVKNITDDWCSEIGSIGIMPCNGGIRRTA